MAFGRVGAERQRGGEPLPDMAPVIGRHVARIDARGLDHVDLSAHRPDGFEVGKAEKNFPSRSNSRMGTKGRTRCDRPDDGKAPEHASEIVRGATDQPESRTRTEGRDALVRTAGPLGRNPPEAELLFETALDPRQLDVGQATCREPNADRRRGGRLHG